jgi:hypothetical protein
MKKLVLAAAMVVLAAAVAACGPNAGKSPVFTGPAAPTVGPLNSGLTPPPTYPKSSTMEHSSAP